MRAGRLTAGFALLVALALPTAALAQPGDALQKARSLFDAGGRAYDAGQYDVALQAFEQAYALAPKDGLLFSMAQAHRRLFVETGTASHRDEAIRLYRAYLDKVPSGKRRADANQALGELVPAGGTAPGAAGAPGAAVSPEKKTRIYVSSATPGLTVTIDGKPAPGASRTFEVSPGKHTVLLGAPGFASRQLDVEAVANELVPVAADLEELPGRVAVSTTSGAAISVDGRLVGVAPLVTPLDLSGGRHFVSAELSGHVTRAQTIEVTRGKRADLDLALDSTVQRDVSFALFGLAGAFAATSGVLAGVALFREGQAEDVLERAGTRNITLADVQEYEDARAERDKLVIGAAATGGAAGAALVVGLGLFLGDQPERAVPPARSDERPRVEPTPGGLDELSFVPTFEPFGIAATLSF
ncbi:MAG: PEGA domain-containing protein [Myxococcales bacterium]|nr:PEGA domain-containing protein [Myxococcales bacterium]